MTTAGDVTKEIADALDSARGKVGHWLRPNDYPGAIRQYEHAATLLELAGCHQRAVDAIMQAVALLPRVQEEPELQVHITLRAVSLQTHAGNLLSALALFRSSHVTAQTTGYNKQITAVLEELGQAFAASNDTPRAVEVWLEAAAYAKHLGYPAHSINLLTRVAKSANRQDLWEQAARDALEAPLLTFHAEGYFLCALAVYIVTSDPVHDAVATSVAAKIAQYAGELPVTRQLHFRERATSLLQAVLDLDAGMDPARALASHPEEPARILVEGLPLRAARIAAQPAHV